MASSISFAKAAVTAALAASVGAANAAFTVYTTSASFAAALGSSGTDTYNNLPIDFILSPLTRSAGSYGYTVSTASGLYGAGTASDAWLSTNVSNETLTFNTFTGGVKGIGGQFFGSDLNGAFLPGQTITLMAMDSLGDTAVRTITNATQTSFLGFVSNGRVVTLNVAVAEDNAFATVNNLVLAVPEPATYAMLLAGLGVVGAVTRRRRNRS